MGKTTVISVSVYPLAYLMNRMSELHQIFCALPVVVAPSFSGSVVIISAFSVSIASGALMVKNIRVPHLSVCKSELWQNG